MQGKTLLIVIKMVESVSASYNKCSSYCHNSAVVNYIFMFWISYLKLYFWTVIHNFFQKNFDHIVEWMVSITSYRDLCMYVFDKINRYIPENSKNAWYRYFWLLHFTLPDTHYFLCRFSILPTGTIAVHSSSMNRTRVWVSDKTGTLATTPRK